MSAPAEAVRSVDDRVVLKDPWTAAILAFLLPGLGHLYQGRFFKAAIYSVCILGTFCCGVALGAGRPVYMYYYVQDEPNEVNHTAPRRRVRNLGYLAQVLVGLPTLPAAIQASRYESPSNEPVRRFVNANVDVPFTGQYIEYSAQGDEVVTPVSGRVSLAPVDTDSGAELAGTFTGTRTDTAEAVTLQLGGGGFDYAPPIMASPGREMRVDVIPADGQPVPAFGNAPFIDGVVPRAFWNWYGVPPEDRQLQEVNLKYGKQWELALVLTWIAGLLNVLAIWDAFDGPAYGYGRSTKPAKGSVPA